MLLSLPCALKPLGSPRHRLHSAISGRNEGHVCFPPLGNGRKDSDNTWPIPNSALVTYFFVEEGPALGGSVRVVTGSQHSRLTLAGSRSFRTIAMPASSRIQQAIMSIDCREPLFAMSSKGRKGRKGRNRASLGAVDLRCRPLFLDDDDSLKVRYHGAGWA